MILYFTGTGNSRYIAEGIANVNEDELVSMNKIIKEDKYGNFYSEKPYVFVVPIYAWKIPRLIDDFIRNSEFKGSNEVYFVVNYGTCPGNPLKSIKALCDFKNFDLLAYKSLHMPENYLVLFSICSTEEGEQKLIDNQEAIVDLANRIKNKERFGTRSFILTAYISSAFNYVFYKILVNPKGFNVNDNCNACGRCVKLCSLNGISLEEGKPKWNGNCTHCMACICACPKLAINFKHRTQKKHRYFITKHFE